MSTDSGVVNASVFQSADGGAVPEEDVTQTKVAGGSEEEEFYQASTEVMAIPSDRAMRNRSPEAAGAVSAETDETVELTAKAVAATPSVKARGVSQTVTPGSEGPGGVSDATQITGSGQIQELLARMQNESSRAKRQEAKASVAPLTDHPDLSTPEPLGQLEQPEENGSGLWSQGGEWAEERPASRSGRDQSRSREAQRKGSASSDPSARLPPFPLPALREWGRGVWQFLRVQTLPVKIGVGVAAGAVLILLVSIAVLIFSDSDVTLGYLEAEQDLMAGPGDDSVYPVIGLVERGEEVTVFAAGRFGDFEMVQDFMGRVGFLPAGVLSPYRPESPAGVPFVGCRQAPIEPEMEPCLERAHQQFDSCRSICEGTGGDAVCFERCQQQLDECVGGCNDDMASISNVPEPILDGPAPVDTSEPVKKKNKKVKRRKRKKR